MVLGPNRLLALGAGLPTSPDPAPDGSPRKAAGMAPNGARVPPPTAAVNAGPTRCYNEDVVDALGGPIMQLPVLIEPVANNGFRAKTGEPLPLSADGATAEEAVRNLRGAMDRELKGGRRLQLIDIAVENPWLAIAATHDPNDALVQEWKQEIAAYRQEVEDDPNRP